MKLKALLLFFYFSIDGVELERVATTMKPVKLIQGPIF